jgi:hypothetical protein
MSSSELKSLLKMERVLAFYNARKVYKNLYFCPFHENGPGKHKPSLVISHDSAKCMSPGYDCLQGSADIFKLISLFERQNMKDEFPSILKKAYEIAGMDSSYQSHHQNSLDGKHEKYLVERGISIETAEKFNITGRRNYLLFPQTREKRFLGYKGISIEKINGNRKIFFEKEANSSIWYEPNFLKGKKLVFLEGEMDLLRFYEELKKLKLENSYSLLTVTHGATSVPFEISKIVYELEPVSVSIIYDNDTAGAFGSLKLAKKLTEVINQVTIYKLPKEKPDKYDLSDYLNDGYSLDSIWSLDQEIISGNEKTISLPEVEQSSNKIVLAKNVFTLNDLSGNPPEMSWMIEDFILCDKLGAIIANGGVGKSWFLLHLALSIATGKEFLGMKNCLPPSNVLYISGEEDRIDIHRRVQSLKKSIKLDANDFGPNLSFLCATGLNVVISDNSLIFNYLEEYIQQNSPKLIIMDPLVRFFDGDENNSTHMTRFIERLERFVSMKTTIIFAHHTNKLLSNDLSQNASRGSSAIIDAVRWNLVLSKITKDNASNYSFLDSKEPLDPEEADLYINAHIVKCNSFSPKRGIFTLKRTLGGPLELYRDILVKK